MLRHEEDRNPSLTTIRSNGGGTIRKQGGRVIIGGQGQHGPGGVEDDAFGTTTAATTACGGGGGDLSICSSSITTSPFCNGVVGNSSASSSSDLNILLHDQSTNQNQKLFQLYQNNSKKNKRRKTTTTPSTTSNTSNTTNDDKNDTTTTTIIENEEETNQNNGDLLLAKELNELSFEERNTIMEDIHGIKPPHTVLDETEDFVTTKLAEMDIEINWMTKKKKLGYERALFLSPIRVRNRSFRIAFLRAEYYHPSAAAKRYINYYNSKLELFGIDKLIHPITLADLNENDHMALQSGSFQVASEKDQSGRTVIFISQAYYNYKSPINQIKMAWYQIMTALEDESAQKYGLVNVVYDIGIENHDRQSYSDLLSYAHLIRDGLPFRLSAFHYCYNNSTLRNALNVLQLFLSKEQRLRFRTHFGSQLECEYALTTFGISKSLSPYDPSTGKLQLHQLQTYIQHRRSIEAIRKKTISMSTTTADIVITSPTTTPTPSTATTTGTDHSVDVTTNAAADAAGDDDVMPVREATTVNDEAATTTTTGNDNENCSDDDDDGGLLQTTTTAATLNMIEAPGPNDILLGRGRPYQEYGGNLSLATMIDQYRDEYQRADRFEKTCISKMIVQIIKEKKNARFLQRAGENSNFWEEVNDAVAREKISHSFRTKNRRTSTTTTTTTTITPTMSASSSTAHNNVQADSSSTIQGSAQNNLVIPNQFWNWQQQQQQQQPGPASMASLSFTPEGSTIPVQQPMQGQQQQQQQQLLPFFSSLMSPPVGWQQFNMNLLLGSLGASSSSNDGNADTAYMNTRV